MDKSVMDMVEATYKDAVKTWPAITRKMMPDAIGEDRAMSRVRPYLLFDS